jgi:hypothetical protein
MIWGVEIEERAYEGGDFGEEFAQPKVCKKGGEEKGRGEDYFCGVYKIET